MQHIEIDGQPACLRPADPEPLLNAARLLGVHLCCSGTSDEMVRAQRLYHTHYNAVLIVNGPCPAREDID